MRFLSTTVAFASLAAVAFAAQNSAFDKPASKQVVPLAGSSAAGPKQTRTCFVYPGFLVKQIDLGEVGADELSIAHLPIGGKPPVCDKKITHETVISADDWSGYFTGAKGDYLVFDAGDGVNGGMPFAVFNAATGKKLFEDSRKGDRFEAVESEGGALILRYRRVFLAPCSLYTDAKGCWKKITAETLLAENARPDCTAAYKAEIARETKSTPQYANKVPAIASVIGYNVEARYANGKAAFRPLPGPTACWLED